MTHTAKVCDQQKSGGTAAGGVQRVCPRSLSYVDHHVWNTPYIVHGLFKV